MKRLPLVLLLAVLACFVVALVHLFQLRFAVGDIYPAYSSLRSDPLGVKALWQSLDQLVPTQRNFQLLDKIADGRATTLFYLGLDASDLRITTADARSLEMFLATGGRLVVSLHPRYQKASTAFAEQNYQTNQPFGSPPRTKSDRLNPDQERAVSLEKKWGFAVNLLTTPGSPKDDEPVSTARLAPGSSESLPPQIRWHGGLVLTNLDPAWRVIYDGLRRAPVVAERAFHNGTLILATDSFCFSNEALQQEPQTSLLAWFMGTSRRAIFDETHFGLSENPGIATLLQKFRLQGVLGALLLLAGLFVWKSTASLIPRRSGPAAETAVQGKDASAGLINLLRRSVPDTEVLEVCYQEWKKTWRQNQSSDRLEQVRALVEEYKKQPRAERRPVDVYRQISALLRQKF